MMKPSHKSSLAKGFISLSLAAASLAGGVATNRAGAQSRGATAAAAAGRTQLSRYATDLTRLARAGRLSSSEQFDAEVTKAIEALARGERNNPVLLGEPGAGAVAVAKGIARRVAAGEAPESLRGARVYALSHDALLAGAKSSDEFAARLRAVFDEAAGSSAPVVIFVDDLHQYVGSYTGRAASDVTRAAVEGGRLHLVGATTAEIYGEHIAKDAALAKLFQPISLEAGTGDAGEREEDVTASARDRLSPDLRALVAGAKGAERAGIIVQADDLQNPKLEAALRRYGVAPDARMAQLGALRVELPVKALEELAASGGVSYLSPDREFHSFGHVTSTTGTDAVRGGSLLGGLTGGLLGSTALDGAGIGIAVLDSGLDVAHRAFAAKLDLSGSRIKFKKDFTAEATPADKDPYGHGSHVAAAAAGMSTVSGGVYEGVARGADIINLRVLDSNGTGRTSDLLAALNWILSAGDPNKPVSSSNPTNATKYKIRVVNMSLGTTAVDSYKNDPLCKAVRRLVDAGIVVVAAAGNNGKDGKGNKVYGQIHSPGNEPSALTVGAANTFGTDVRSDDGVATFSSRGPTRSFWTDDAGARHYDNLLKPDLVAPGNKLIYAESDDKGNPNLIVRQNPQLDSGISDSDNRKLMYLSGTSMATPVVAGTVALMLQVNPTLTPNMVKMILMYTSQQLPGFNTFEQGAGELNVEGAVRLASLVRTDLSSSTKQGDPLLTKALPDAKTTIGGYQFPWAQGILLNQHYATGTNLIARYQTVYGMGYVLGDGTAPGADTVAGDGHLMGDAILMGDGILLGDNVLTSSGFLMGDGAVFMPCGHLMGDGILLGDGHLMGDGILLGDGHLMGDNAVAADAAVQAMSAMVGGDPTPGMRPTR